MFRIGRTPLFTQTVNSPAATHDLRTGKRGFNAEYDSFIKHLGMTPRTISLGHKEQNGDVEASNGALKRRLAQELMLRGNADFESVETYEEWLQNVVARRNRGRQKRFNEELVAMRKVDVRRLAEFVETDVRVTSWSTIRVKHCAYSVPSRLIGERVRVRIYERNLAVYYGGHYQFQL